MRTNIDIDDELLAQAMHAGPYATKKETVEAGLRLLARQAAYREVLKWEGKLKWEGDESVDWTEPRPDAAEIPTWSLMVQEPPPPRYSAGKASSAALPQPARPEAAAAPGGNPKRTARHAGR